MMNVQPSEAARLTLHDYQAMLWHWNEAHRVDDGNAPVAPPDIERVRANLAALNAGR